MQDDWTRFTRESAPPQDGAGHLDKDAEVPFLRGMLVHLYSAPMIQGGYFRQRLR